MITISDIQSVDGWESKTPEQIAAALNANPLHHRDAPITGGPRNTHSVNLLHLMTARFKVMGQDRNQSWFGPLVTLAENDAGVANAMTVLYPHLQVENSVAYCSSAVEAARMVNGITAAIGGLLEAAQTGTTADVVAAVTLLTGGRKYGSVTAEQVAAVIAEHTLAVQRSELLEAWQPLYNQHISPVFDGDAPTIENLIAGLRAAANALEG